jgi:Zn-dependent protease with chaperone function
VSAQRKGRSNRSSSSRDRVPRHVEPVLDPNWQNPYTPSSAEREANRVAIRHSAMQRIRPVLYGSVALFIVTLVLAISGIWVHSIAGWWWPFVGIAIVGLVLVVNDLRSRRLESSVPTLANSIVSQFQPGGTAIDTQRLAIIVDRLSATFGLNDVQMMIVRDAGYNAALLAREAGTLLVVTDALMSDYELIEVEGVVAHLMARERLNALSRLSAASLSALPFKDAHQLAGVSMAYRADEVAAAGIRYPQGLASALAKCAAQVPVAGSYFSSDRYNATRWMWFNVYADRPSVFVGDLDDALLRSAALAEW